jgi:hypothetical protein
MTFAMSSSATAAQSSPTSTLPPPCIAWTNEIFGYGKATMPTAEQCRIYAAGYQRLGIEVDVSIRRATVLMGIANSWLALATQLDQLSIIAKDESK